jgi:hypothetical protein
VDDGRAVECGVDSLGAAAFVGFWAFWLLLVYGYVVGELSPKHLVIFVIVWLVGRVALAYLPTPAPQLFSPYVAVLDIALVFVIFEGDMRLY